MKIAIIGTGYVGLVTGACFARMGNRVACVEIDRVKLESLRRGQVPIYEPGLQSMVKEYQAAGDLSFTPDLALALEGAEAAFLTVGTPTDAEGNCDLTAVFAAAEGIGKVLDHHLVVVTKSTVPVGTTDQVGQIIRGELAKRQCAFDIHLSNNPEFLKEGAAVEDFMSPDRVVLGTDHPEASELLKELYRPFCRSHDRFLEMDIRSSEMTKYASNAMLAARISFMNEVAGICEAVGADVNLVRVGMGSDPRIGYHFLYPGTGFGGSCFPKDLRALHRLAADAGQTPELIQSVLNVNERQKSVLPRKVQAVFGDSLEGLVFAVWGLAFKPETDDLREAPSLVIIRELVERGARIQAYDPKAASGGMLALADLGDRVRFAETKYEALKGAEALLLVTEWKEFRSPDFDEMAHLLKRPVIFDGRNQYNRQRLAEAGFEYHQIGAAALAPVRPLQGTFS